MKKFVRTLCIALLLMTFAFSLTGCSKANAVKRKFEDEGYSVTIARGEDAASTLSQILSEEQQENISEYEVYTFVKQIVNSAVVIVFPSKNDLKETLSKNYDSLVEAGKINGNLYAFMATEDALKIFKSV